MNVGDTVYLINELGSPVFSGPLLAQPASLFNWITADQGVAPKTVTAMAPSSSGKHRVQATATGGGFTINNNDTIYFLGVGTGAFSNVQTTTSHVAMQCFNVSGNNFDCIETLGVTDITFGNPTSILYSGNALGFVLASAQGGIATPGSAYTNGSYTNVAITGGSGSGATANITVSGASVTALTWVNCRKRLTVILLVMFCPVVRRASAEPAPGLRGRWRILRTQSGLATCRECLQSKA